MNPIAAGPGIFIHDLPDRRIVEAFAQRPAPVSSGTVSRHPWQALIIERGESALTVKVWQPSTLLESLSWTDKATITGFGDEHELTASNHLRLTVEFDTYGVFSSATLAVSSAAIPHPWVAASPTEPDDHEGTWVQIIAKLRVPVDGEQKAITLGETDYALYCPTTTHLLADWFCEEGQTHPALLPWFGSL